MRKQCTHKPIALRFRRWSRKGYAAFISIQRAVTIGQLSAHAAERFQVKNGSTHASVLTSDKTDEGEGEEEKDICRSESIGDTLSLLLLPALSTVRAASRPAASYAHISKRNYFRKRGGSQLIADTLPAFCLHKYEIK